MKPNISPEKLKEFEQHYSERSYLLKNFSTELVSELNTLIEEDNIHLGFPLQSRVKQWESVLAKLHRLQGKFTTLDEIQDLVGLRVILLFQRDVQKVCELISTNLSVIRKYNTQERLAADQFGYSSTHFVVEMPETWLAVPTLHKFSGLRAEVQVRTVAQHIWAEVSHTLQYKQETSVPLTLRRGIYRVSALLETVDLEFERVLTERATYRQELDITSDVEELNVDNLEKLLDSLLPADNKGDYEPYSEFLEDLQHFQVNTPAILERIVRKHLSDVLKDDTQRVDDELQMLADKDVDDVIDDNAQVERIMSGVFFTHIGLARGVMEKEFGNAWYQYLVKHRVAGDEEGNDELN